VNYLNIKKVLLISIIILLGGCFVNQEEEQLKRKNGITEKYFIMRSGNNNLN